MGSLVYVRLIGFTFGTLLQLFWMVMILGYRRQRNFERVFFSLSLALFFFYAGSLLALNAQIYYLAQRFNFLQIGRQKNLVYAVSATFLALLYLSLVRRLSGWMDPQIPPEATAAILLFVLVIFFEPLQRFLARRLEETARQEMDRVQRLTAEIQHEARQGNEQTLARFIERRLQETFELAAVRVTFQKEREIGEHHRAFAKQHGIGPPVRGKPQVVFSEGKITESFLVGGNVVGIVRAEPHGSALSGETRAALEFLCEQLLGALDLCRLIDDKVRLERELAERERLALLGQMAASISHNLKNPLGSIKTILQVQMENPELPGSLRGETQIVLDEVGRLSSKLNQLLQFSRPAVRGGSVEATCDAAAVIEEVAVWL